MASIRSHVVYEPIDHRSLSKKEKSRYLDTAIRKPRLERCPSIGNNGSDYEVDLEAYPTLEAPPELSFVTKVDRKSTITIETRQWQSLQERLKAELRKLDSFWSFKSIPRDTISVSQTQSRAALTPASSSGDGQ